MCCMYGLSKYGIVLQDRTGIHWAFILFAPLWATPREAAISLPSRMEIRAGKRIQRLGTKSAPHVNKTDWHKGALTHWYKRRKG